MNKLKEYQLKNGLKIYLYIDKSKHSVTAHLISKIGYNSLEYTINNEKHQLKREMPHLLEHYLIEQSTYGIVVPKLNELYALANGYTTPNFTCYYFDTVKNLSESLEILLKGIHSPIFSIDGLEFTKKSIREEIRGRSDSLSRILSKTRINNLFKNHKNKSLTEEINELDNITLDEVEKTFYSFYNPSNEIIIVSGNFNEKEVLKKITDIYDELKFESYKVTKIKEEHNNKVAKKEEIIYYPTAKTIYEMVFKVPIYEFSNLEIMKLDWYFGIFLKTNFGILSKINLNLQENKIVDYKIEYNLNIHDDYFIVGIGSYVNDIDEFKKAVLKSLEKPIYDEELYNLENNQNKINVLLREENLYKLIDPFIENLITYNFLYLDSIEFLDNLSFEEYKEIIGKLDFSNYSEITVLDKKN